MQQVYVKFKDVEQIRDFVNIIDRFDGNFDMGSGRRIVDAKSILGIAALDLTQPQKLCFETEDDRVLEKLKPFLLEKESKNVGIYN